MNKKGFTLIELIVSVAVLGILAAIIIPNISNIQEKSIRVSIENNIRNIQTASDMYALENYKVPTISEPTKYEPKEIDFNKIYPENIRNLPKESDIHYWIDVNGTVWGSKALPPSDFKENVDGTLSWGESVNANAYRIYEAEEKKTTSSATQTNTLSLVPKKLISISQSRNFVPEDNKSYLISTIDENGFSTAPIGLIGSGGTEGTGKTKTINAKNGYVGFKNEDYYDTLKLIKNSEVGAKITLSNLVEGKPISISVTDLYDNPLTDIQYRLDNGSITNVKPTVLSLGNHTLSVKGKTIDQKNSIWVTKNFVIERSAPDNVTLKLDSKTDTSITLKLTGNNANSFEIYRDNIKTGTLNGNTYVFKDVGLISGKSYTYKVRAINEKGYSESTNLYVTTILMPTISTFNATSGNASANLSFTSANANSIKIYRDNVLIKTLDPAYNSFVDSGLTNGSSYNYYIEAVNQNGVIKSGSIRVQPQIPRPSNLNIKILSKNYDYYYISMTSSDATSITLYEDDNPYLTFNAGSMTYGMKSKPGTFKYYFIASNSSGSERSPTITYTE